MKLDINSVLAKAAQKTESKPSKSKTPIIELPDKKKVINDWIEAQTDLKDAEARKATAEASILPAVEDARLAECRRDGKFYSSIKVDGKITVSTQNRYSPINTSDYPSIESLFGDKAETFFKQKMAISLTDAALTDESILQKLIAAVGADKFSVYFDVKQFVEPTETFHESRSINPEIGQKAQTLISSGILKPYKSAVKLD